MAIPSLNREDLVQAARGLLMGGADIIPGVSGGTVALILGIYARLVTAISHVDGQFVRLVFCGRWSQAAAHVDLRFLIALACGIATGIVSLASLMHSLLEHHRSLIYAAFFGLILGSSLLVGRAVRVSSVAGRWRSVAMGGLGAFIGVAIALQQTVGTRPGHSYTFLCGAVAICAMILPGISGAHILLLLGKYEQITGIIKKLPRLDVSPDELATLAVFALGCILGLIAFSKLLRWLLGRWHAVTMSVLCGFMLGSLVRIWPFQQDMTPAVAEVRHKIFRPTMPQAIDQELIACGLIVAVAFAGVLLLDRWARRTAVDG